MSQRDLAEKLGIDESGVSRDERNEYHGITTERAQRILDALGAKVRVEVDLDRHHQTNAGVASHASTVGVLVQVTVADEALARLFTTVRA